MRQSIMRPFFVEFIPERLEEGVLYVSEKYQTASHLCCCGCREEVVTPLGAADWSFSEEGAGVTLFPSIGNWSYPCQSHYWIRQGQIVWAGKMTPKQIARVRARDQSDKATHIAAVNQSKENHPLAPEPAIDSRIGLWLSGLWHRLWAWFK